MKNLMHKLVMALIIMISLLSLSGNTLANILGDEEQMSEELTTLFRSARGVISANQKLINDASIGNKGLTPERIIKLAKDNFKKATGNELAKTGPGTIMGQARAAMLNSIKVVINEAS